MKDSNSTSTRVKNEKVIGWPTNQPTARNEQDPKYLRYSLEQANHDCISVLCMYLIQVQPHCMGAMLSVSRLCAQ